MNEYNYKDITKITDTGIVFKDGTGLSFEECTASWNASHGLEQGISKCIGERNIADTTPYFLFYTEDKIKVVFERQSFFNAGKYKKEFLALQKAIIDKGYSTYDLS